MRLPTAAAVMQLQRGNPDENPTPVASGRYRARGDCGYLRLILCRGRVLAHGRRRPEMGRYRPAVSEYARRDPGRRPGQAECGRVALALPRPLQVPAPHASRDGTRDRTVGNDSGRDWREVR